MLYKAQTKTYDLRYILLDLNGTLTVQWKIQTGTKTRIQKLQKLWYEIHILSWNQRWNGESIAHEIGIWFFATHDETEKESITKKFPKEHTVAIGNARIDNGMFKNAILRIGTLQKEWIHTGILPHIDILMLDINDAFDILLDADTLSSTMKA